VLSHILRHNPHTYSRYTQRERRGMESISFQVMTRQTASQAIYSFVSTYRRAPRHCLCLLPTSALRLFRSTTASRPRRGSWHFFSGLILISRCHDIYHLGVLALLTGASGIRFSFLRFFRSPPPSSSRWARRCPRLDVWPCSRKQYRLSLSIKLLLKSLILPCHSDSIRRVM
jgi:hypothetical protein